jgi:hypothetical protein
VYCQRVLALKGDRVFRPPYRWLPRTIIPNLHSCWLDVYHGFRNIRRWLPILWFDSDFDWEFLARIMEAKLRWMAENTTHWHVAEADRSRRQMVVCSELLRRLREDAYLDNARRFFGDQPEAYRASRRQARNDMAYFGRIVGKYLTHWWD